MKIHGPVKQKRKYQYEESHYPSEQYTPGVVAFLLENEGKGEREGGRQIHRAAFFILDHIFRSF